MRFLLESLPRLVTGRSWSSGVPWRVSQSFEWIAARKFYRRPRPPTIAVRNGTGDANLLFAGDLALHRWSESDSPEQVFRGVRREFDTVDFRGVNLEAVFTTHQEPGGKIGGFRKAPPFASEVLKYLNVDAVTLANNHALDFGAPGLAQCLEILRGAGIACFGVDDGHPDRRVPGALVQKVNGVSIGLVAATDHFGGMSVAGRPSPVWARKTQLETAIRGLRPQCHVLAVHLHWGYEYVMYPTLWHRDLARSLIDLGADIVCCHHAHVVMGLEAWGRGVIAHGLGNFYSWPPRVGHPLRPFGTLLRLSVGREGLLSATVVPVKTHSAGQVDLEGKACPGYHRLCDGLADGAFLASVESARVLHETVQLTSGLRTLLEKGDAEGLLERQAFLKGPRQEWLLDRGEASGDPELKRLGSWLRGFGALPEEAVRNLEVSLPPEVPGLNRWKDSRTLPGRLP